MFSIKSLCLVVLPLLVNCNPIKAPSATRTIQQLDAGNWLENIAVRANGDILATRLNPTAQIYTISHPSSEHSSVTSLLYIPISGGYAEITHVETNNRHAETFVIVANTYAGTPNLNSTVGGSKAYTLTFRSRQTHEYQLKEVSSLSPRSSGINGSTSLPGLPNIVFLVDSGRSTIGRLNISSGVYCDTAFDFEQLRPVEGGIIPLGVNGIKARGRYMYFSNSSSVRIFRIPVTAQGYPTGNPELVADLSSLTMFIDDFNFDPDGNIYAATFIGNVIIRVDIKGQAKAVVGAADEQTVASVTSLAFGRGRMDHVLYATTGDSNIGSNTVGGRVIRVDTRLLKSGA